MDPGPRMVPTSGSFSTPLPSAQQLDGQPSAAYSLHGHVPPGPTYQPMFQSPVALHAQWPTPGVAYMPMAMPSQQLQAAQPPLDASRADVAALTTQLAAAVSEIGRLSNVMGSAPSPTLQQQLVQPVHLASLGVPPTPTKPAPPPSWHPASSSAVFATITSSTSEAGDDVGVERAVCVTSGQPSPLEEVQPHLQCAGAAKLTRGEERDPSVPSSSRQPTTPVACQT